MTSSTSSPFAFRSNEKIDQGFIRILDLLAIETQRPRKTLPAAIHETRVLIKRFRALLWFAKPALPPLGLAQAKSRLQEASHLLTASRDLAVMRFTLKKLSEKTPNSGDRKILAAISKNLGQQQALDKKSGQSLQRTIAILLQTIREIKQQAKASSKWPSPSKRLIKAFHAMKKVEKKALCNKKAVQFHEWRKKTKRLLYQLELTQLVSSKRIVRTIKRVDKLQKKLGDYHDNVVAQDCLRKNPPDKTSRFAVKLSVKLLEKRNRHLRKKVQKMAKRIHLK